MLTLAPIRTVTLTVMLASMVSGSSHAAAPWAAAQRDGIPMGVGVRDEAGVAIDIVKHTPEAPLTSLSVKNTGTEPVTGVRFVAVIERFPIPQPIQILSTEMLPVQVAPGAEASVVATTFPPALRDATMSGERMQIFVSVREVRFASGRVWEVTPDPNAPDPLQALRFPTAVVSRAFMLRQAATPASGGSCVNDVGRPFSEGAVVDIVREPGRQAKCVAGRWQDYIR